MDESSYLDKDTEKWIEANFYKAAAAVFAAALLSASALPIAESYLRQNFQKNEYSSNSSQKLPERTILSRRR